MDVHRVANFLSILQKVYNLHCLAVHCNIDESEELINSINFEWGKGKIRITYYHKGTMSKK